jgi:hypothetical protein
MMYNMGGPENPFHMAQAVEPVKSQVIQQEKRDPCPPLVIQVKQGKLAEPAEKSIDDSLAENLDRGGKGTKHDVVDYINRPVLVQVPFDVQDNLDACDQEEYSHCDKKNRIKHIRLFSVRSCLLCYVLGDGQIPVPI